MSYSLNRQQRRDLVKPGGAEKLANEIWNEVHDRVCYIATRDSLTLAMLVLRDKYGFGAVRLRRFLECVSDHAESVRDGRTSINDIITVLKHEVPDIESFWQKYRGNSNGQTNTGAD